MVTNSLRAFSEASEKCDAHSGTNLHTVASILAAAHKVGRYLFPTSTSSSTQDSFRLSLELAEASAARNLFSKLLVLETQNSNLTLTKWDFILSTFTKNSAKGASVSQFKGVVPAGELIKRIWEPKKNSFKLVNNRDTKKTFRELCELYCLTPKLAELSTKFSSPRNVDTSNVVESKLKSSTSSESKQSADSEEESDSESDPVALQRWLTFLATSINQLPHVSSIQPRFLALVDPRAASKVVEACLYL